MNPAIRTIKSVIETNLKLEEQKMNALFRDSEGKKVFKLVSKVTGKLNSVQSDYAIEEAPDHFGKQTVVIKGKKGFIRVALVPLFEVI